MKQKSILLVEDEKKIANILKLGLSENGYNVQTSYDGISGWKMFNHNVYDLILLDINMPGMNGLEFCKRIREKTSEAPVVMLTALSTIENKIDGYNAGADDYIAKPFHFKELLMKINVLLKRTSNQKQESNIIRAADLVMDIDTKVVKRGDYAIQLTAKEFQLLEYLVKNKNKVITRAALAKNVWAIDFDTNTNIIDVYINYIRNKVDKPFSLKLIQTQVGMGYILKDN